MRDDSDARSYQEMRDKGERESKGELLVSYLAAECTYHTVSRPVCSDAGPCPASKDAIKMRPLKCDVPLSSEAVVAPVIRYR